IARGLGTHKMNLRLVPKQGRGGVVLLDDTYNSSPASAQAALDLLAELPGRHLAVLGDMLELGAYELEGHRQVGQHCAQVLAPGVDVLIAVGPRARHIADAALAAGMDESLVYTPADNPSALELIRSLTQPGDIVLVKGSRGMAMEQIVDPLTTDDRGAQHG
ncbi:MAG: UDP-N-acetylmuramoylalanyl-D-glutamyl-2, 6-diaminopimelate--D-alanyl-D-alanine ligase, partial [Chloroflexi bacterium]|nr:UDP-N-acetylmuramoylalanyl-D-glutamyl-2, 6-diaminopimelate--D-alanyl-D-alanine ligase [Chloroflexota bacterium]